MSQRAAIVELRQAVIEEKVLITGNETIPQLPPATANAYVPDKIFIFEMSASEAKRIADTYDDFIVVKGSFTYDNYL